MRKFIINLLLSTLSKKSKKQILKELNKAIKLVTRKRGPRGPYKKTKYVPTQETVLPRVEATKPLYSEKLNPIPDTNPYNDTKYKYTKTFAKMKVGDITWFKRPRQNISSIACTYGKSHRKTFECRSIGKNSTEVKRVF